jgi:hypothetical protein
MQCLYLSPPEAERDIFDIITPKLLFFQISGEIFSRPALSWRASRLLFLFAFNLYKVSADKNPYFPVVSSFWPSFTVEFRHAETI